MSSSEAASDASPDIEERVTMQGGDDDAEEGRGSPICCEKSAKSLSANMGAVHRNRVVNGVIGEHGLCSQSR